MKMPPRFLFRLFPWAGRTSFYIEQRFPSSGRLVLGLLICAILFGIDIRQTLGYQIASVSFAFLFTSILLSLRWRPRISIRRVLPDFVTAMQPVTYYLEISNHGTRVERDLVVLDELEVPRIAYADFQRRRRFNPGRRTNWVDRAIGFYRWVDMRRHDRGAEISPVAVPTIAPGSTVRVKIDTRAVRRGWLNFQRTQLLRPDPLGLFRARLMLDTPDSVLALPQRYAMAHIRLRSERRYQRGGVSLALAVGDSQEFAALRDYRAGDPRRHIHWRSFAKTGRLIVKQYQDEYFDRHALVIDTHIDEREQELFEAMIAVAASVAGGERPRDSILDVIFLGTAVIQLSAGRGLGDAAQALAYLAQARPAPSSDFDQLAGLLRARAAGLASVIVVLGVRDEKRTQLLDELARGGIPSVTLLVTTNEQIGLNPQQNGPHQTFTLRTQHLADDLRKIRLTA